MTDVGLVLPTRLTAERSSPQELLEMAELADGSPGWGHLWVTDSVIALKFYESLTLLAACAARTTRVRLGIGCMSTLGLRHPLLLAQQLANLDVLSRGRITVVACPGWATGEHVARELSAFGVSHREKARRMEEGIAFLRRVSARERPNLTGERITEAELDLQPSFLQRPLPIWMAANPPLDAPGPTVRRLLERVARLGAGWMTYAITPQALSARVELLRELRAAQGQDPEQDFPVSVFLSANVNRDEAAAIADAGRAWREQSTRDVSAADLQRIAAVGTPDRCAEFIAELVQAGATSVALDILGEDRQGQLQALTSELLPRLSGLGRSKSLAGSTNNGSTNNARQESPQWPQQR